MSSGSGLPTCRQLTLHAPRAQQLARTLGLSFDSGHSASHPSDEGKRIEPMTAPSPQDEHDKRGADAKPREDKPKPDSQAIQIIRAIDLKSAEFFHTPAGEAHASVRVGNHVETYRLSSREWMLWVHQIFYRMTRKCASSAAVQAATNTLAGIAQYEGPEHPVSVRVTAHADAIYLDLGGRDWTVIEITREGWKTATSVPVRFRRPRGLLTLPAPVRGGSLTSLRRFVNVADEDFPLVAMADWGASPEWTVSGVGLDR